MITEYKDIENIIDIEAMLEEIRSDLDDRSGFHLDIDTYEEYMKQDWINIVSQTIINGKQ